MAAITHVEEAAETHGPHDFGGHVRQAILLINPTAGKKAGLPTNLGGLPEVEAALTNAGITFETIEPESSEDTARQAKAAAVRGAKLVIAAGGDGTVQQVAFALMGSETALGIMPLGSFNNVARSLGIPRDLAAAGEILRGGASARIDVGLVGNQHFLEAAGIGLDAAVMPHSNALGDGRLSALRAALNALRTFRKGRLTMTVDGRRRVVHAFMVTVANASYTLADLHIVPVRPHAQQMTLHIPSIGKERGQIHATNEGNLTFNNDGLLIVAVWCLCAVIEFTAQVTSALRANNLPHIPYRAQCWLREPGSAAP